MTNERVAAVTGVTGYVGGRLVPELLRAGFRVRGIARNPGRLRDRPWRGDIDVTEADLTDPTAIREALEGVDVAYYLVHSLSADDTFAARDRRTALTFAQAAREAGVSRIVYLGGMHPDAPPASSRSTSSPAARSATSCSPPACRRRRSRPPSSSARGRPRSR
ncbi:NAD(P)H-binding protein [Litorihabitans aurantiacus]|uniref:NAD(P)-binding domain-containing protein n=1 Tax=Litorihabitans aurantiacus TaxID=1930061 RepID=A0AA38CSW0_9MICO|nr:hypothetical protein GCM10025875_19060 [Litorihabitans aurantiacus]